MADLRKDKGAPASLKVKYKSATVDQFIAQFGPDISPDGIFVKTKKPVEAGALLKFSFMLSDKTAVLSGVGKVAWRREPGGALPPGMGIRFLKLAPASQGVVDRIVQQRGHAQSRFEQQQGAELAPVSLAPSPVAAPAPSPIAAPAPIAPPPAASRAVAAPAGLFATTPISQSEPPQAPPEDAPRTSFFPPAPGGAAQAVAVALPSPSPLPAAAEPGTDVVDQLIASISERPAAAVPAAQAAVDDDAGSDEVDALFGQLAGGGLSAELPEPAPQMPTELPASVRPPPAAPAAAASGGDESSFAGLGDSDAPPSFAGFAPPAAHTPAPAYTPTPAAGVPSPFAARAVTPAPSPFGAPSATAAPSPFGAPATPEPASDQGTAAVDDLFDAVDEDDGFEDEWEPTEPAAEGWVDDDEEGEEAGVLEMEEFGEADLFGSTSAPPPPADFGEAPLSLAPVLDAEMEARGSGGRSGLLIGLVVLLLAGGGGAYYLTRGGPEATPPAAPSTTGTAAAPGGAAAASAGSRAAPDEPEPAAAAGPAGPPVSIEVTSVPRGSELSVDGEASGTTPTHVELASGREVSITVQTTGYAALTKKVTPVEGMDPIRFKLDPLPYAVVVHTTPPGAEVSVGDERVTSPAPLELGHLMGSVHVNVAKEGFRRMSRPVRLEEFVEQDGVMRAEVEVRLSPLPRAVKARKGPKQYY